VAAYHPLNRIQGIGHILIRLDKERLLSGQLPAFVAVEKSDYRIVELIFPLDTLTAASTMVLSIRSGFNLR